MISLPQQVQPKPRDPTVEELAFARLLCYASLQWPDYHIARHHKIIAEHLEKIESREIRRLLITMPPRSGKTMLTVEYFGAWYLGRNPSHQIIFATYSHDKAADHGLKIKQQMEGDIHQAVFRECRLSKDSKSKNKLSTTAGGNLFAVGIGGALVGRGAHVLLLDDVIKNREEAESEIVRKRLKNWYQGTAYTRLMPNAAIVFISTRWHTDDLVGYLLKHEQEEESEHYIPWVHLNLPAIAESEDDIIKREVGEALWPEMYPVEVLNEIKSVVETREWNSQYQQRPVGEEGGLIKYDWLKYYEDKPKEIKRVVQSWDTAYSPKDSNDPTVCITFGETKNKYYILDVFRKFLDYPNLKREFIDQYNKRKPKIILVENKGSGQSLIQDIRAETRIPIKAMLPIKDKYTRFSVSTGIVEAGKLYLPNHAKWLTDFVNEIISFPLARHDDCVDALSQYLAYVKGPAYRPSKKKLYWK